MISRVAEACFWLHRHMERADAMARLLRVNQGYVLDAQVPDERKWYPLLVVSGEHERFDATHRESARGDADVVREYLTWDSENPVSLHAALYWARENARTIREVVSLDMWETLNELWHWLGGGAARRLYRQDADAFYRQISDGVAMFQGVCHNTMLHETPFDFMRLGMLLERAGQTARVLDVHYHTFEADDATDIALSRMQWLALLQLCSATTPFLKRNRAAPTGERVVGFLVLEDRFPRSIVHCLQRGLNFLGRVRPGPKRGEASWQKLSALRDSLAGISPRELQRRGVHAELTRVVEGVSAVCNAIHIDYFDPTAPGAAPAPASSQAES